MDKMSIDARVLIQGRYNVPKTISFSRLRKSEKEDVFISAGYYHYFRVKRVELSGDGHPLKETHSVSKETQAEDMELILNTSEREMYLFTNFTENPGENDKMLSEKQIDEFWEGKCDSICISYVHLNDKKEVEKAIEHLRTCFSEEIGQSCCIYYLSIDYCDIVVFCKNINFGEYLRRIYEFCYESQIREEKQLIKDCISFNAFGIDHAEESFKSFNNAKKRKELLKPNENKFIVRFLFGVLNSSIASQILEKLKEANIENDCFFTYGRQDFSITINQCTMERMLYIMYLIDDLTKDEEDIRILTFESYVGIAKPTTTEKDENKKRLPELYDSLIIMLQDEISKLEPITKKEEVNSLKLNEIARSLSNIQKSGFGEDFTLCVYESLKMFLKLIGTEHESLKEIEEEEKIKNVKMLLERIVKRLLELIGTEHESVKEIEEEKIKNVKMRLKRIVTTLLELIETEHESVKEIEEEIKKENVKMLLELIETEHKSVKEIEEEKIKNVKMLLKRIVTTLLELIETEHESVKEIEEEIKKENVKMLLELIETEHKILKEIEEEIKKENEKNHNLLSFLLRQENDYFNALNSLINCMMHSERQFIQTTNFDAMFFSVPSKLMSFYASFISLVTRTMREPGEAEYAFHLVPALAKHIEVDDLCSVEKLACTIEEERRDPTKKKILEDILKAKRPYDKLLVITINEDSLFDTKKTTRILVHEIAHYVGDSMRCRDRRRDPLLRALVAVTICCFDNNRHSEKIIESSDEIKKFCQSNGNHYAEQYDELIGQLIGIIWGEPGIEQMSSYFSESNEERTPELGNLEKSVGGEFWEALYEEDKELYMTIMPRIWHKKCRKEDEERKLYEHNLYATSVVKAFKESYADLHMILMCDLSLEEYVKAFIVDENQTIDDLLAATDTRFRIACIIHVMKEKGKWKLEDNSQGLCDKKTKKALKGIEGLIQCYFKNEGEKKEKLHVFESFVAGKLKDYLDVCFKEAKKHYENEKTNLVDKVREYRKTISSSSDIVEVFRNIEDAKDEYRKYLMGKTNSH